MPNMGAQVQGMRMQNPNIMSPRMGTPSMRFNQPMASPVIGQNKPMEHMLQNPSGNQNSQMDMTNDQAMAKVDIGYLWILLRTLCNAGVFQFQMAASEIRQQQRTVEHPIIQQFNMQSNSVQVCIV